MTKRKLPFVDEFGRTEEVLAFIEDFMDDNGYAPVIREIGAGCDISSTSVVSYHLDKLIKSGLISKMNNKARTIKLLERE